MKDLDAGRAVGLREVVEIVGRGADVESEVDDRPCGGQPSLASSSSCVVAGGTVLGISRKVVTPPLAQAREARSQIFFVRQTRFAKVDLIVDHARQQVHARGVDRLVGCRSAERDRGRRS